VLSNNHCSVLHAIIAHETTALCMACILNKRHSRCRIGRHTTCNVAATCSGKPLRSLLHRPEHCPRLRIEVPQTAFRTDIYPSVPPDAARSSTRHWKCGTTAFRPLTLTSEVWQWPLTLTFNPGRAIVMTHTQAKGQCQRSLGSKVKCENIRIETDRRTDERTEAIALPPVLTRSVKIQRKIETRATISD